MDNSQSETDPLLRAPSRSQNERIGILQKFSSREKFLYIEISMLLNVFLSGFDTTVTTSTYTTIGNNFHAARFASWVTTSYLITSTAFQPLYGSISDIVGRRYCVFFALIFFTGGCLGCSFASNFLVLCISRAVTGIGGGGLVTLSTIIHSDIIHKEQRGLFQAFQNLLLGFGSICGASLGGIIASKLGWKYCFILQCPLAFFSLFVAVSYVQNQEDLQKHSYEELIERVDFKGGITLLLALLCQLLVLSLGGNELAWQDYRLILIGLVSFVVTALFFKIEMSTTSKPIINVRHYRDIFSLSQLSVNFFIGLSALAYLFILPLYFQLQFGDSISRAGFRLIFPSIGTPIGGLLTGVLMTKGYLRILAFSGISIMTVGNCLVLGISKSVSNWLLNLVLVVPNLGQGIAYPSSLFTFLFAFGISHQATSTSTVYLMRSIGGVWGVSASSALISLFLRNRATADLKAFGMTNKEIHKILSQIKRSTDTIGDLRNDVREIILKDYLYAIKAAQLFSAIGCALGLFFFLFSIVSKRKPHLDH